MTGPAEPADKTTDSGASDSAKTEETKTADSKTDETKKPSAADALKKDLADERKKRQELEAALKAKDLAGMEEGERLKTEHADATAAVQVLTKQVEDLTKELAKRDIALDLQLPLRVAKRLQGETEEEMRADAQEFLKDLKLEPGGNSTKSRPPNDAKKGATSDTGKPNMNDLLRIAAGRA